MNEHQTENQILGTNTKTNLQITWKTKSRWICSVMTFFSSTLHSLISVSNPIKYLHELLINDVNANWTFSVQIHVHVFIFILCISLFCFSTFQTMYIVRLRRLLDYSYFSTKYAENVKLNVTFFEKSISNNIYVSYETFFVEQIFEQCFEMSTNARTGHILAN